MSWRRFEVGSRGSDARTETVKTAQFRRVRRTVVVVWKRKLSWGKFEVGSGGGVARTEAVKTVLLRCVRRA